MKTYNFGEKNEEYSSKQGKKIPVLITDKFEQSKAKAIEIIEKYDDISEGDFWILMNETKTGKMMYTGLIITHNGCLKINDHAEQKFVPSCVSLDKEGYGHSLVFTYANDDQGIYEVGEVAQGNCRNPYPYAMAYKRLFDRVVLKLSRLAYGGIYSEVEADEFRRRDELDVIDLKQEVEDTKKGGAISDKQRTMIIDLCKADKVSQKYICDAYKIKTIDDLTATQAHSIIGGWSRVVESYKRSKR